MCSCRFREAMVAGVRPVGGMVLLLVILSTSPIPLTAGPNADTTLPLAAWDPPPFVPCDVPVCNPEWPHLVNMPLGSHPFVTMHVRNHDQITGVQTAFDWGSWTFVSSHWDCQTNQVNGTVPAAPGGPIAGTVATAFDCIAGGETEQIGYINLIAAAPGCLMQIESGYPNGTHVLGCGGEVDPVPPANRGRICVDEGGYTACDPVATAVEPASWGRIKGRYR